MSNKIWLAGIGLLASVSLSGCVLVIGDEDVNDSSWATEHKEDIADLKTERKADAQRVMADVRRDFNRDTLVRDEDIRIAVRDGVVTLSGETASAGALDRALQIASDIEGVDAVVSRVVVILRKP